MTQEYILFQAEAVGPDIHVAMAQVEATDDVLLLRRNSSALLIEGTPASVQKLSHSLPGWTFEPNQHVRGGV